MDGLQTLVHKEIIDTFEIAKLAYQPFSEIDHLFSTNHSVDLKQIWNIIDKEGITHSVIYNKSEEHPIVLSGWWELQNYYSLLDDVSVVVAYYGNNVFEVVGFKELTTSQELPKSHSRFIYNEGIFVFDVDITPMKILRDDFAQVLRDHNYEVLELCGVNRMFYKSILFVPEDMIIFRLDVTYSNKKCHVYKD
ncbi:unnamed protein product [Vicia faba]|uniref:Uncharacterized protein n=1 Tax=Vicia faba TaxID=3906 RepID=A0AAV1A1M8_VICFA|nr:unnamed protein product [Vicia faba]